MAQSGNPFRGGNVVHRIELPRRRRPGGRTPGGPVRPPSSATEPPEPQPASPPPPPAVGLDQPLQDPSEEGQYTVVDVEFEVLDGSRVPHAQLTRAQERQVELEFALQREANAQAALKASHREEVDMLERRLTKLRGLLEAQEVDLRRAVSEGQVDSGWSSCYRGVQGLDRDDPGAELKREMLAQIFEANQELQTRIAALGA